jgi:hypothetical protein
LECKKNLNGLWIAAMAKPALVHFTTLPQNFGLAAKLCYHKTVQLMAQIAAAGHRA